MRRPMLGDDVMYHTDGRGGLDYWLPAKVVLTHDSHAGPDSPLPRPRPDQATLAVFSPGVSYTEALVSHGDEQGQWLHPWEYHEHQARLAACVPMQAECAANIGLAQPCTTSSTYYGEAARA